MASDQETERTRPHPSIAKKILLGLAITLVLVCVSIEALSRLADGIVARRKSDPSFDAKTYASGLMDKLCLATLDPLAEGMRNARAEPHPYLGYALKPGWRSSPGDKQQVTHNALGFRGKETSWPKPAGVLRIVTLGGSSVYGSSESSDAAVWSQRLEELLNEKSGGKKIEVINGGCQGYTSFEMLASFEYRLIDFQPDVLIVYEAINDMKAALYTRAEPAPAHDNTHYRRAWAGERPSQVELFCEHSRTFLVWRRYGTSYAERSTDVYSLILNHYGLEGAWYCGDGQNHPGEVPDQGFLNYRRNLNSLISVADAAGVKVLIATQALIRRHIPDKEDCRDTQIAAFDRIQNIQREVAAERGVHLVESARAIEAEVERVYQESGGKHDLFKNDVHPFDDGSELIARTIGEYLLSSDLIR